MSILTRLVQAMRGNATPPRPGIMLKPRREDALRGYPADGLTPPRLIAILREADAGSLTASLELFEQMEEKDAHLYSVAHTRRLAVTGLGWEIVSAADLPGWSAGRGVGDQGPAVRAVSSTRSRCGTGFQPVSCTAGFQPADGDVTLVSARDRNLSLADDAAAYCQAALREAAGFEEALDHLALALGRNIAVVELVWEADAAGLRLAELAPVDFGRLTAGEFGELRILTDDEPVRGIEPPADKFAVHRPHAVAGHFSRGGLGRVTALAWLGKRFAIKDWLIFAEVYGMPMRIARYAPSATPDEKRELIDMLKQLGADATAIFSKAVDVEIKQTRVPGETNLYEGLCVYLDREMSKAWLGRTLTTDTAKVRATLGAATAQAQVRRDIRDDDIRKEARTIRRDVLAPLTRLRFGPDAPVPHFRRIVDLSSEPEKLAGVLSVAVNELGARVPARWAHAALGLPEAREGEQVLRGK